MALTNKEIIMTEKLLHNIELDKIVDTFAGWNKQGYTINKGSKALFQTKIWKPTLLKNKDTETKTKKIILVNASFFSLDQVTKIDNKNIIAS